MRLTEGVFLTDGLWRCSFFGQFCSLTDFSADNLQLEYTIQLPDRWFCRNTGPAAAAVSHKCLVNEQRVAHINLPFSINLLVADEPKDKTKTHPDNEDDIQQQKDDSRSSPSEEQAATDSHVDGEGVAGGIIWPRVCVRVFGMQVLGQRVMLGSGSASLPHSAGTHTLTIPTCAPLPHSHADRLSQLFLGFVEDGDDETERDTGQRRLQGTETAGSVVMRVSVVKRSEASVEKRVQERQLLSASIEQVVAAFERAKLQLTQLRSSIMLDQKDYNNIMIQRTSL